MAARLICEVEGSQVTNSQVKPKNGAAPNGLTIMNEHPIRNTEPVARELAPVGLRSSPMLLKQRAGAASQPSGSKLPRHGVWVQLERLRHRKSISPLTISARRQTHSKRRIDRGGKGTDLFNYYPENKSVPFVVLPPLSKARTRVKPRITVKRCCSSTTSICQPSFAHSWRINCSPSP